MTQAHEGKILVGLLWIKWFSGIAATMTIGCFVFLWNINAFRASANVRMDNTDVQVNRVQMDINIHNDVIQKEIDAHENQIKENTINIIQLQDNKKDK